MNIGNIPPAFLLSLSANQMKWYVALSELCDNSFDASATRVVIRFPGKAKVEVIDDGAGCPDIERMLTLGVHLRQRGTALGMWGVGLKEAACWMWGELYIDTTHRASKKRLTSHINWEWLAKQAQWDVPDPQERAIDSAIQGTRLSFVHIKRSYPEYSHIAAELSYWFSPAIRSGMQIVIEAARRPPIVCAPWTPPPLENVVQDEFDVNGKGVRLHAGVVPLDYVNSKAGFTFAYRHRVILNSALGSNGHSVSRFCGIVELLDGWKLSKNKTEIVLDDDMEALEQALFTRCEDALKQSAGQSVLLHNTELEQRVTDGLRSALGATKKARRASPQNKSGTRNATGEGSKHRSAKKTQPGDSFLDKCDASQIRMEWKDRDDSLIGDVDIYGGVVYLNPQHARLSHHKEGGNADAIVDFCMTLLVHEAIDKRERARGVFPQWRYDSFVDALSNVSAATVPEPSVPAAT